MEDFEIHGRFRLRSLLNEADPPGHSLPRGLISGVVSPPVLKGLRDGFEQKAKMLVDELLQRRQFDGVADFARAYPLSVFQTPSVSSKRCAKSCCPMPTC